MVAVSRRVFEAVPKQVDLAKALGVTSSAISNLKKRQRCSLELVLVASEITGRPIEWFLFGEVSASERMRKRVKQLSNGIEQAGKEAADLTRKIAVAEKPAAYRPEEHSRLAALCHERLAALEEWIRVLERRLAELETKR